MITMKNQVMKIKNIKGFTLVELMITLAVISILAAIAIPSYSEYFRRTQRSNARNTLIQAAQWMERAATASGRYPLDINIPATIFAVQGNSYVVAKSVGDTNSVTAYSFTATPVAGQAIDVCGSLVLDQANARTTRNSANTGPRTAAQTAQQSDADCWGR
jgi:type IV pilus assembly protein PilE